jgi:hypothetical protein
MLVNLFFDDDRLMFCIPVNPYHGTQSAFRRRCRTKADGRTGTTTANGFGCLRLGLRRFWKCVMHALTRGCRGWRPSSAS